MRSLFVLLALAACPAPDPNPPVDDDDSSADDDDAFDDDDSATDDDDDVTPPPTGQQQRGAWTYATYCASCHGDRGQGYAADDAPMLANQSFLSTATDEFLRSAITHGRPSGVMSAWGADYGGPLPPDAVDALVAWLRFWQVAPTEDVHDRIVSGDPEAGAATYALFCRDCHGSEGEGDTAPALADPWLLETASDGFLRYAIEAGRPGTEMPSWGQVLSESQIDDLVALLRSRATPVEDTPVPPFEPDLTEPVVNPDGPLADFSERLLEGRYVPTADVFAAYAGGEAFVLLDARPGSDYLFGHIAGAISVPFYRVDDAAPWLPQDAWLVAYCGCPHELSGQVADSLAGLGFAYTAVLDEGWFEWLVAGHPTTSGPSQY